MPAYEYKIIPAPSKGVKGKGIKGPEARFANALEVQMNAMAADGWEYQRAETLPSIERSGLTSTTTEWRNVLVFRRLREADAAAKSPELLPAPEAETETDQEPSRAEEAAPSTGTVRQDPPLTESAKLALASAQNTDAKPAAVGPSGAATKPAASPVERSEEQPTKVD